MVSDLLSWDEAVEILLTWCAESKLWRVDCRRSPKGDPVAQGVRLAQWSQTMACRPVVVSPALCGAIRAIKLFEGEGEGEGARGGIG